MKDDKPALSNTGLTFWRSNSYMPQAQLSRGALSALDETSAVICPTKRAKDIAVTAEKSTQSRNGMLASLSHTDASLLAPLLKVVSSEQGQVLNQPGDEIEHIHFPHDGMISLLAVMMDGRAIETATVGREGVVGGMAGLGLHVSLTRAVVQTPMVSSQIAAVPFRKAVRASDTLRDLMVRYNEVLLAQVQVTAACNALHSVDARLARWILQTRDRVSGNAIPLTHELLSEMLGVRRSSVSEVAARLQAAGLIRYSRGLIEIVNRKALEEAACECYEAIREKTGQILGYVG